MESQLIPIVSILVSAVIALTSVLGSVFGPALVESRKRKSDKMDAVEFARFERALEFVEALSAPKPVEGRLPLTWIAAVNVSRARFAATLRNGEQVVDQHVANIAREATGEPRVDVDVARVSMGLFGFLRGEIPAADLWQYG
jgi:hypothetical protein